MAIPTTNVPSLDQLSSLTSLAGMKGVSLPTSNDIGRYLIIAGGISTAIMILALWSLIWKGIALWLAARRGEKGWFTWLLVLNTVGILEISYIFAIAKRSDVPAPSPPATAGQPPAKI